MATYTYKCSDCGNISNIKATIQEKEDGKGGKFICSECRSKNIAYKFSTVNFMKNIFAGDGKSGGCCADGKTCGDDCKSDSKENSCGGSSGCC